MHTSVGQASSAVEIVGDVYGIADAAGGAINRINFSIGLAAGATPVDINKTVLTFSTSASYQTLTFDPTMNTLPDTPGHWTISHPDNNLGSENKVLDSGEQFTISISPPTDLPAYTNKVNLLY